MDTLRKNLRSTRKMGGSFMSTEETMMEDEVNRKIVEWENLDGKVKKMKKLRKSYSSSGESHKKQMEQFLAWMRRFDEFLEIDAVHVDLSHTEQITQSLVEKAKAAPGSPSASPPPVAALPPEADAAPASQAIQAPPRRRPPPRASQSPPHASPSPVGAAVARGDAAAVPRSPRRRGRGRVVQVAASASSSGIRRAASLADAPDVADGASAGAGAPPLGSPGRGMRGRGRGRARGRGRVVSASGLKPDLPPESPVRTPSGERGRGTPGRPIRPPRRCASEMGLPEEMSDQQKQQLEQVGATARIGNRSSNGPFAAAQRRAAPPPRPNRLSTSLSSTDVGKLQHEPDSLQALQMFASKPLPKPKRRSTPPAPPPKPSGPPKQSVGGDSHSQLMRVVKEKPRAEELAEAVGHLLAWQKAFFEFDVTIDFDIDRTLLFPMSNEISEFVKQLQALKKTFDKNRAEYIKAEQAVAKERSKQQLDVVKLFLCEREVVRTRPPFSDSLRELFRFMTNETRIFALIKSAVDMFLATKLLVEVTCAKLNDMERHVDAMQSLILWKQMTVENCRLARAEGYEAAHLKMSEEKYMSLLKVLTDDGGHLFRALADSISTASKSSQENLLSTIYACYSVMNRTHPPALSGYVREAPLSILIEDGSLLGLRNFMHTKMDVLIRHLQSGGEAGLTAIRRFLDGLAESESQTVIEVDIVTGTIV